MGPGIAPQAVHVDGGVWKVCGHLGTSPDRCCQGIFCVNGELQFKD